MLIQCLIVGGLLAIAAGNLAVVAVVLSRLDAGFSRLDGMLKSTCDLTHDTRGYVKMILGRIESAEEEEVENVLAQASMIALFDEMGRRLTSSRDDA